MLHREIMIRRILRSDITASIVIFAIVSLMLLVTVTYCILQRWNLRPALSICCIKCTRHSRLHSSQPGRNIIYIWTRSSPLGHLFLRASLPLGINRNIFFWRLSHEHLIQILLRMLILITTHSLWNSWCFRLGLLLLAIIDFHDFTLQRWAL